MSQTFNSWTEIQAAHHGTPATVVYHHDRYDREATYIGALVCEGDDPLDSFKIDGPGGTRLIEDTAVYYVGESTHKLGDFIRVDVGR